MNHLRSLEGHTRWARLALLISMVLLFCNACEGVQVLGKWESETASGHDQLVFKYKNDAVDVYTNGKLVGTGKWDYDDFRDEQIRISYNGLTWRANLSDDSLSIVSKGRDPIVYTRVED